MNVSSPKNRVTSRHLGQRRDVPESFICNVMTLQRGFIFQVVTLNPTSQRSREVLFQRRDVGSQRRDIPERYLFNVATFLGGIISTS